MNHKIAYREALLIVLIFLLGYLFIHFNIYDFLSKEERIISFIKSADPYDQLVFMAVQVIQVVIAPIPGEVTGFIGGYIYGPIMGTIYSTIGLTLGSGWPSVWPISSASPWWKNSSSLSWCRNSTASCVKRAPCMLLSCF